MPYGILHLRFAFCNWDLENYAPSRRSLTSLAMRFSSCLMTLSSSRERASPTSSLFLLPKHIMGDERFASAVLLECNTIERSVELFGSNPGRSTFARLRSSRYEAKPQFGDAFPGVSVFGRNDSFRSGSRHSRFAGYFLRSARRDD
jgi:hypothetical protein